MRETKFRGQRVDTKEWAYGSLIRVPQSGNSFVTVIVSTNASVYSPLKDYGQEPLVVVSGFWHRVIPETVGQYTGLKDKNGKEIYEGDIIQVWFEYCSDEDRYTVEWQDDVESVIGGYAFRQVGTHDQYIAVCDTASDYSCELCIEVIGNIYENPELLTQSTK